MFLNQLFNESSLADQMMALAKSRGMNPRLAGTPEQEKQRTADMMAQRAKDREAQAQQSAQADASNLESLKAEYQQMKASYESLGGSNWQYADREQNLSDSERRARSMEPELNRLAARIKAAEKSGVAEAVAGPENCWPGYRKVGTKPGTGKNAGKRVNDCEKISEEGVAEGLNDTVYPNAEVIKSKNGKPVGEIYQDGNEWGCFHYKADRGYDMIDSREDAIQALKDLHQETGRSRPDYTVKGVAEAVGSHNLLQDIEAVIAQFPDPDDNYDDYSDAWDDFVAYLGMEGAEELDAIRRMPEPQANSALLNHLKQIGQSTDYIKNYQPSVYEAGVAEGEPGNLEHELNRQEYNDDKIGGRYDPDEFDQMVARLGQKAKEQERKHGPVDLAKLAQRLRDIK